ncbi:beta-lactamase family protein [Paenibacillus rhizovicinus]|uniref:Beta-lactamase family protein n=1 Tax=Paenibacillus rhizovicinus TaxID=2704463 RepID=A0A6C0P6B0_9BACL|nr:serine hydrolase domain-containing protein [Paenibacillus rhizovicinus]QHW33881.1 beta-lactamase family protein [Paenibacillus rhizovicinus]
MNAIHHMIDQLDARLDEYMQHAPMPGLAVGVVFNNRTIYAKGFGLTNAASGEPVGTGTLFHQASISKTAVATGIMQLAEQGRLELDAGIVAYLPYFHMADDRFRLITVRQLLNHTSGMPDEEDYEWDRPQYDDQSLERYVRSLRPRSLLSEPGENYAYSNIGYEILGDIIAKRSGTSFEQYMKERIFEPALMRESTYLKSEADDRLAAPHVLSLQHGYGGKVSDVFPYHRAHGPSSTMYAHVEDMCRYAIVHLNKGITADGQALLTQESYDELWTSYAATGHGEESANIGLSWFIGTYKGQRMVSHSGMDTGFQSHLVLLPDKSIAVAVMANADYGWLTVGSSILDFLLTGHFPTLKQSMAHHLAQHLTSHGIDSAMQEHERIKNDERYYSWEGEYGFIAAMLKENGYASEGARLLTLSAQLFPDSSDLRRALAGLLGETIRD